MGVEVKKARDKCYQKYIDKYAETHYGIIVQPYIDQPNIQYITLNDAMIEQLPDSNDNKPAPYHDELLDEWYTIGKQNPDLRQFIYSISNDYRRLYVYTDKLNSNNIETNVATGSTSSNDTLIVDVENANDLNKNISLIDDSGMHLHHDVIDLTIDDATSMNNQRNSDNDCSSSNDNITNTAIYNDTYVKQYIDDNNKLRNIRIVSEFNKDDNIIKTYVCANDVLKCINNQSTTRHSLVEFIQSYETHTIDLYADNALGALQSTVVFTHTGLNQLLHSNVVQQYDDLEQWIESNIIPIMIS